MVSLVEDACMPAPEHQRKSSVVVQIHVYSPKVWETSETGSVLGPWVLLLGDLGVHARPLLCTSSELSLRR